jgi:LacI family transcriptional regulator
MTAWDYMIEKYHRPAHYLTTDQGLREAPERYAGYRDAMKDAGFGSLVEEYTCRREVLAGDNIYIGAEKTPRHHFQAAGRFLDQIQYPASVLCEADTGVPDIYENAASRGKVVGKDLFVASFGALPLAKFLKPSLTTIRPDLEELGIEAGRLLHRLIKKEVQPPVYIHLPVELVIRESA